LEHKRYEQFYPKQYEHLFNSNSHHDFSNQVVDQESNQVVDQESNQVDQDFQPNKLVNTIENLASQQGPIISAWRVIEKPTVEELKELTLESEEIVQQESDSSGSEKEEVSFEQKINENMKSEQSESEPVQFKRLPSSQNKKNFRRKI